MDEIIKYFVMFMIYSIIGWIMEVIVTFPDNKKFVNRGFLIGPYCPIYGWGYLLITLLLKRFMGEPIALFGLIVIVCSVVEYLTSYLMEKFFHARWWDYSQKKYNIEGRICLINSACFGFLGMFMLYVINPFFEQIINSINMSSLTIIAVIMFVIYLIDNIISFCITTTLKNKLKKITKDNTSEIKDKMKELIRESSIWFRRLAEAFPNYEPSIVKKIKDKINKQ